MKKWVIEYFAATASSYGLKRFLVNPFWKKNLIDLYLTLLILIFAQETLWFRQGISDRKRQGESWLKVCPGVTHVSVNEHDDVYIVNTQVN